MTTYTPLDSEAARRSHAGTSFHPEKRGEQEIEYHKELHDELQAELGDFYEQKHADKLRELWMAYLHSHAAVLSPMITGPANFPVARNEKRSGWADTKRRAIFEYAENLRKRKGKADRKAAVDAAGGELAMKNAQLANAKKWHETMKSANRIIRKAIKTEGGINSDETRKSLSEIGLDESVITQITLPNCFGGYGFEPFQLTNSNARIKSMTARVAELERQEAAKESGAEAEVVEIAGGVVVFDHAENRINVKHDEKPERSVIDLVKSHGFRWSRNYGTWTRKMTPNAKYAAQSLIIKLREIG